MKLKNKIYIIQIFLAFILFSFLTFTYFNYQIQYEQDIKEYVDNEVKFRKQQLLSSYNNVKSNFTSKKKLLKDVHSEALNILKKDIDMDIYTLRKELSVKFNLEDVELNIFLINKKYTIYKTTFPKDLGFNLNIVLEAKEFLNKTTKDKKIYVADHISMDMLDMRYKLYSYSFLKDDRYLELGFVYKNVQNILASIITKDIEDKEKIKLYMVFTSNKKYSYYDMSMAKNNYIKSKLYQKNKIWIKEKDKYKDNIIYATLANKSIIVNNGNSVTVFTPFFDKDMYTKMGFSNITIKMDIDISSKVATLKKFQTIFIVSFIVIFIFLLFVFVFIKNSFTKKIDIIIESINNKKKIKNKELLDQNDELSIVSKEYNSLFDSLIKEIQLNENLLLENKRFIADTVHQIRTPLTNIIMNGEMIKKFQTDDKLSLFIEQIDASTNMLSNSYEDLAYITSYDSIDYKSNRVSLTEILNKRIKFFSTISKVNYKEIVSNIEDDIYIHINEIELERIIDNNISNGIKYGEEKQPITITLNKEDDTVTLTFKTYGNPILNKEKIFEKNYRENEAKRGLGLGLNIVKGICEKYNIFYSVSYEGADFNGQNIFRYTFKI